MEGIRRTGNICRALAAAETFVAAGVLPDSFSLTSLVEHMQILMMAKEAVKEPPTYSSYSNIEKPEVTTLNVRIWCRTLDA